MDVRTPKPDKAPELSGKGPEAQPARRQSASVESGWQKELDELAERKRIARQMGGKERVERQHAGGRLTVRERIDKICSTRTPSTRLGSVAGKAKYDKDGNMIDFMPGNGVFGRGRVDGRPVIIFGDDFTVRGGSADASIREKYQMPERMAAEFRMPIIRIIEGSGGGGSVKTIETKGYANLPGGIGLSPACISCAINMGRIPVVALGLGSVAGLGAARLSASHYSLMVKEKSAVFVAGPPVVDRLGEKRTKQELGGHKVQIAAGTVDDAVDTEEEAFATRAADSCPTCRLDLGAAAAGGELGRSEPARREPDHGRAARPQEGLPDAPHHRRRWSTRARSSRSRRGFGRAIITGFARLDGWPVGIAGWRSAARLAAPGMRPPVAQDHEIRRHLPDLPPAGRASRRLFRLRGRPAGGIRPAPCALRCRRSRAIHQSTVPWCSIIVRNVFGVGGGAHLPHTHSAFRYSWPSGNWGSLPLEGGVEAAYRAEIDAVATIRWQSSPRSRRGSSALRSPFRTAEAFLDRGDHRSARHAAADLRVRQPGRAAAQAGARVLHDAWLMASSTSDRGANLLSCSIYRGAPAARSGGGGITQ